MTAAMTPDAAVILDALQCDRSRCACHAAARKGRGNSHCPAHHDSDPSLSVKEDGGRVLVHCHAGCSQDAVLTALRERGLWSQPTGRTNRRYNGAGRRPDDVPVLRWPYVNADGEVLAFHCRRDLPGSKPLPVSLDSR